MDRDITVEMLAFNLKMLGKRSKKNILISAGNSHDKERMLPAIRKLTKLNVEIYATEGTHLFLYKEGIDNHHIFKISNKEKRKPNIESFLRDDRFDLVINILVGNHDYDEASDSRLIRTLSIENGIPLITDVDVAVKTIDQMVSKQREADYKTRLSKGIETWNLKLEFFDLVEKLGGFACHHAHLDKAYLISLDNLKLSQVDLKRKWELYRYLKENYTLEDLVDRISMGVQRMIEQGVTYFRTMVDADSTVKLLPIKAALQVKNKFSDRITMDIGVQPLEGLLDKTARSYFRRACEIANYIGGLPSKDRPQPERHLDYLMGIAKELDKKIDVHVDQENNPDESETELLAVKTIEHGLEGKVNAIHAISVATKTKREQDRIIKLIKDAGIGVIACPSAAISMKQLDKNAPLHNSIAPVVKFIESDVPVYLGVDNICDLFMPLTDGDIWMECRMLMEACRFYDIEKVAEIACKKPDRLNENDLDDYRRNIKSETISTMAERSKKVSKKQLSVAK